MFETIPPPPKSLPAAEAKIWTALQQTFYLNDGYSTQMLEEALTARGRARQCAEVIKKEGLQVQIAAGTMKAHPLLPMESTFRRIYITALGKLRLDHADVEMRDGLPEAQVKRPPSPKPAWVT